MLRAHVPDHLRAVREAVRTGDAPGLREAAHKIAGTVGVFSTAAGAVASEMEDCAAAGELQKAAGLAGRLETMAEELMPLVDGLSLEALRRQAGSPSPCPGAGAP